MCFKLDVVDDLPDKELNPFDDGFLPKKTSTIGPSSFTDMQKRWRFSFNEAMYALLNIERYHPNEREHKR